MTVKNLIKILRTEFDDFYFYHKYTSRNDKSVIKILFHEKHEYPHTYYYDLGFKVDSTPQKGKMFTARRITSWCYDETCKHSVFVKIVEHIKFIMALDNL
jgi:hypothetical protein